MSQFTIEQSRTLLELAGVFFSTRAEVEEMKATPETWSEREIEDEVSMLQMLNLNDTWAWAVAYGLRVPDEDLPEVAEMFFSFGWCGILYWAAKREGIDRSQFEDVTRRMQFVQNEMAIMDEEPSDTKRAFLHKEYTITGNPPKDA